MTQNDILTNLNGAPTDAVDLTGVDRAALAQLDLATISVHDLAAWLYDHGAAHLSAIERIELAERLTRRRFIIGAGGLLGAAALGACGVSEEVTVPTPVNGDYPRTVQHALGEVRIISRPERIGCMTNGADLQTLVALGIQPIGVGLDAIPMPWVEERIAASVDTYEIPNQIVNIERVATWQPDMFIGPTGGSWLNEESITTFEEIAPTVAVPFANWRESLRIISEMVGMESEANRLLEEIERSMSDLGERLGRRRSWRLAILDSNTDDSIYITTTESPVNEVLVAAGMPSLYPATSFEAITIPISLEVLPDIEADVIMLTSWQGRDGTTYTDQFRLLENEIFQAHPAVQAGRVVSLDPTETVMTYYSTVMTIPLIVEILAERIAELPA